MVNYWRKITEMHTNYKKLAGQNVYVLSKKEKTRKRRKKKKDKAKNVVRYKDVPSFIASREFLKTGEWRKLRYQALIKSNKACHCCGATPESGAILNVDHIMPRKRYPKLALDINNLQVLCHECNHGKGNWDQTDHR